VTFASIVKISPFNKDVLDSEWALTSRSLRLVCTWQQIRMCASQCNGRWTELLKIISRCGCIACRCAITRRTVRLCCIHAHLQHQQHTVSHLVNADNARWRYSHTRRLRAGTQTMLGRVTLTFDLFDPISTHCEASSSLGFGSLLYPVDDIFLQHL